MYNGLITVRYTRKQAHFKENNTIVPTSPEGKCFEDATSGLPCVFVPSGAHEGKERSTPI